jgi:hypothetical protein
MVLKIWGLFERGEIDSFRKIPSRPGGGHGKPLSFTFAASVCQMGEKGFFGNPD